MDQLTSGLSVTMTSWLQIQSANVFNNDSASMNGKTDPYKVVVTAQTPIISGDMVNLTFPTDIGLPGSVVCSAIDNVVNISCAVFTG